LIKRFVQSQRYGADNVIPFPKRGREPRQLILNSTIRDKLKTIRQFYQTLHRMLDFIAPVAATFRFRFTRAQLRKGKADRNTPTVEQAKRIVDSALDNADPNRASTWYLIGRLMRDAGLRAGGCSSIGIAELFEAMADEDYFGDELARQQLRLMKGREITADLLLARRAIKDRLKMMSLGRRTHLFVLVTEKGSNTARAPIPIALVEELLDYVWDERAAFVAKRQKRRPCTPPDQIFLSYKGCGPLQPETVSNRMSKQFKDQEVNGSGHRLRGRFITDVVRDLYLKAVAQLGRAWDAHTILETAAQYLRHSNTKSLKYYLNKVLREEHALQGVPVVASGQDASLLRGLVAALDDEVNGENTRVLLHQWAASIGIKGVVEAA
jgi:hypothetical protein